MSTATATGIWARIENVATNRGLSVSALARLGDGELLRVECFGRKSLAMLRTLYPNRPARDLVSALSGFTDTELRRELQRRGGAKMS